MSAVAYALVDGNNFFVSCERVFAPELEGRPVVVLSNNDGCCIARSDEAKALGIRMAQPYFEVRDTLARHGGVALSSNYTLYADMSRRMMEVIGDYSPEQEIYSIDESFLRFSGFRHWDLTEHGRRLRRQVRQWTGIPVGIGIGASKTLAKLANRLAKKHPDFKAGGVCNLADIAPWNQIRYFTETAVEDLWGIGRRWGARLREMGIESAQDLKLADPELIRARFGVVLERSIRELNGISCIDLEAVRPAKQQIIASRSFGRLVDDRQSLLEAVAAHAARAATRLRQEGLAAGAIQVFLSTHRFIPNEPQHHPGILVNLSTPTADSGRLIRAARSGLRRIYKPGYRYQKAGVMLLDMWPAGTRQGELFAANDTDTARQERLADVLDTLNTRFGKGTLRFAAEGTGKGWAMRRECLTPAYTTNWRAIPVARA
jgi:DNA polymerase V